MNVIGRVTALTDSSGEEAVPPPSETSERGTAPGKPTTRLRRPAAAKSEPTATRKRPSAAPSTMHSEKKAKMALSKATASENSEGQQVNEENTETQPEKVIYKLKPYAQTRAVGVKANDHQLFQACRRKRTGRMEECTVKVPGASLEQNREIAEVLADALRGGTNLDDVMCMKDSMMEETRQSLEDTSTK
eukprot:s9520_g2.t1